MRVVYRNKLYCSRSSSSSSSFDQDSRRNVYREICAILLRCMFNSRCNSHFTPSARLMLVASHEPTEVESSFMRVAPFCQVDPYDFTKMPVSSADLAVQYPSPDVKMNPMSIEHLLRSSSSSSNDCARALPAGSELALLRNVVRRITSDTDQLVQVKKIFAGDVHLNCLLHLSDGSECVMKCSSGMATRTMRSEYHSLSNESRILSLLNRNTRIPLPRKIKYSSSQSYSGAIQPPYLLRSYIRGRLLCEAWPSLDFTTRTRIDRSLGTYFLALSSITGRAFGPPHVVHSGSGSRSWRKIFLAMLEAALRDAEDILVSIPYDSIRYHISSRAAVLDSVTVPRLTAIKACLPEKVLVNEDASQITGLLGFGDVVWGDPDMAAILVNPSSHFLEGLGGRPPGSDLDSLRVRRLM